MAAIARPGVRKNRDRPMSQKLSAAASSVASGKVPAPVRVRLKRVNCDQAIPYPPDGQQMACTHSAAMAVLNRLGGAARERTVAAMASAAA